MINTVKKRYLAAAALFLAGFAAAFSLALWLLPQRGAPDASVAAMDSRTIRPDDLLGFFQAVARKDFPAMAKSGERVFVQGDKIENAGKTLAGYETNSFPPHTVYAFFSENLPDKTRRVLLTLDGDDRVTSFMAEEMSVIQ